MDIIWMLREEFNFISYIPKESATQARISMDPVNTM
jgi:hypothetical protein